LSGQQQRTQHPESPQAVIAIPTSAARIRQTLLADGAVCAVQFFSAEFTAAIQRFSQRESEFSTFAQAEVRSNPSLGDSGGTGKMGESWLLQAASRPLPALAACQDKS
jgi:hypothetical protein